MRRRLRLVGVLVTVGVTVGGALVTHAVGDVEQGAEASVPARRLAVPHVTEPVTAVPPATGLDPAGTNQATTDTVIALVNEARVRRGLSPYTPHPQLTAAAQLHSDDMAAHDLIGHTGSDGSDGGDRLTAQGFTWGAWGENIGAGQTDAQSIVSAWMESVGHRPQLIGDYQYVGVGMATSRAGAPYWTLVVATGS